MCAKSAGAEGVCNHSAGAGATSDARDGVMLVEAGMVHRALQRVCARSASGGKWRSVVGGRDGEGGMCRSSLSRSEQLHASGPSAWFLCPALGSDQDCLTLHACIRVRHAVVFGPVLHTTALHSFRLLVCMVM